MSPLPKLLALIAPQKQLLRQQRELAQLRDEVATLRAQNNSMREGMQRCVTCDYRIDFKERQDELAATGQPDSANTSDNKH